jgi:hypothetical protein
MLADGLKRGWPDIEEYSLSSVLHARTKSHAPGFEAR